MPPSIEETAELRPISRDPSWFVLALAALAAAAFIAGVYWALPAEGAAAGEHAAARTMPPAGPAGHGPRAVISPPAASAPGAPRDGERADGYLLVASASPEPPAEPPVALPAEARRIFVHYSFPDWPAAAQPRVGVTVAGQKTDNVRARLVAGPCSFGVRGRVELSPAPGRCFPQGIYVVRLTVPDGREELVSFVVISRLKKILGHQPPAGGLLITDTAVAPALTPEGAPAQRTRELGGPSQVYFWFAYDGAVEATVVEIHWFFNDRLVDQASARLRLQKGAGTAAAYIRSARPLPAGKWSVGVYVEGGTVALAGAQFTITPRTSHHTATLSGAQQAD